jgi:hypothetical protein
MKLPDPCVKCAPNGGRYQIIERGDYSGAGPCECKRGKAIQEKEQEQQKYREGHQIKHSARAIKTARQAAEALAAIPGCQQTESALSFLASDLLAMATNPQQLLWLVKEARLRFQEFPSPRELRALFCAKFEPRDGIEIYDERFARLTPPPLIVALPAGHVVSIESALDQSIQELAQAKAMPRVGRK